MTDFHVKYLSKSFSSCSYFEISARNRRNQDVKLFLIKVYSKSIELLSKEDLTTAIGSRTQMLLGADVLKNAPLEKNLE